MPLFTDSFTVASHAALRFLMVLPLITVLDTLYSFLLTCIQVRFFTIKNFRLLFGKLFLIFGGVLAPLSDLPNPWGKLFLSTPFSDLIFQPCYFSIQGEFYQMTPSLWLIRIGTQMIALYVLGYLMYKNSRRRYHNFGG